MVAVLKLRRRTWVRGLGLSLAFALLSWGLAGPPASAHSTPSSVAVIAAQPEQWHAAWSGSIGGNFGGAFGSQTRADATYRQAMTVTASGSQVRVRFVNPFGASDLVIDHATVAIRDGATAEARQVPIDLTVDGSRRIRVAPGELVYTDPVVLRVRAGQQLLVSTYARDSIPYVSHDFGNRRQYATPANGGDVTASRTGTGFAEFSTATYWVDAIDVVGHDVSGAVVALGDSITDGAGSPVNTNTRWTDVLAGRLQRLRPHDPGRRSVLNAGIGGGTLNGFGNPLVGENGLLRLERDVLSQTGVTDVIVFEGSNDIFLGASADEVIHALRVAAERVHDAGLRAIVATLIPRGNGIAWTAAHEVERQEVNAWIRANPVYDAVVDFDRAVADPDNPQVIRADYDADGTHPNSAGYAAMGAAVDVRIFTAPRRVVDERLRVLHDFESGTQGWSPGDGVDSLSTVGTFLNGPGRPMRGRSTLDAALSAGAASLSRTVTYLPATPLDLSAVRELFVWVDAYGGAPGATGYEAELTVSSGTETTTATVRFVPDRWNRLSVDLGSWPHRESVTRIDVTHRVLGGSGTWVGAHLQVDDLGVVEAVASDQ